MSSEPLSNRLRALQTELAGLQSLDDETRRLAGALAGELRRLGATAGNAPPSSGALEALAVRFEADHPAVAAALRQVADQLGKAGI